MKILSVLMCLSLLTGCATTGGLSSINTRIETRAERLATIGGDVLQRVGPLLAAGACIAAPEYCVAAKAAYRAANATINAIRAAKSADDGLKLATLGEEFVKKHRRCERSTGGNRTAESRSIRISGNSKRSVGDEVTARKSWSYDICLNPF